MIYALFSMINNGSLYFTNRKNYPTGISSGNREQLNDPLLEQQLSLESDPAQPNSHGQKPTSVPEVTFYSSKFSLILQRAQKPPFQFSRTMAMSRCHLI